MTDIDYGAALGLETTEGAEGTEAAAPSEAQDAQGAEAQEPAAPAAEETEPAPPEQESGKTEEDARYAAARRRAEAERDQAIARVKKEAEEKAAKSLEEFFQRSGLVDPYTKKPIRTREEYESYRERYEAEQKASLLKKSGMSDAEFQAFVQGLPEVQEARRAKEQAQQAAQEAREAQAKVKVAEQLKEIQEMDPSIKELGDLAKLESYPKIYDMVKRGYSISDAYRLANYDALTHQAAEKSRQAALQNAQSKQHLSPTTQRGTGSVSVPEEIKREYRLLMPDATDAEIQKHYQKYVKK